MVPCLAQPQGRGLSPSSRNRPRRSCLPTRVAMCGRPSFLSLSTLPLWVGCEGHVAQFENLFTNRGVVRVPWESSMAKDTLMTTVRGARDCGPCRPPQPRRDGNRPLPWLCPRSELLPLFPHEMPRVKDTAERDFRRLREVLPAQLLGNGGAHRRGRSPSHLQFKSLTGRSSQAVHLRLQKKLD